MDVDDDDDEEAVPRPFSHGVKLLQFQRSVTKKVNSTEKHSPGTDEKAVAIFGDELEVIHNTLVAQKFQYIFGTCKRVRQKETVS